MYVAAYVMIVQILICNYEIKIETDPCSVKHSKHKKQQDAAAMQ